MKRKFSKTIFALTLGAFLAGSSLSAVMGAGWLENITVRSGIQLNLNGENVTPTDASGKQMPVFLYGSTTYVPVRYISEKYGKSVEWDGENATVHINDPIEESPEQSQPDLDSSASQDVVTLYDLYHAGGCIAQSGIFVFSEPEPYAFNLKQGGSYMTFKLDGQYDSFSIELAAGASQPYQFVIEGFTMEGEPVTIASRTAGSFTSLKTYSVKDLKSLTISYQTYGGIFAIAIRQAYLTR